MKKGLILFFLLAFCVYAQEASEDSSVVKIEYKSLLLTVVSWPFVNIVQPTVEFLMYPMIPPLIYISRENLIEKGHNLITYGENKQIMFYPIINAKLGSAANVGFVYMHSELFLDNDNMFISPHLYINADWSTSMRYIKNGIYGNPLYWGLNASYRADIDNVFRDMKGNIYSFTDSSVFLSVFTGVSFTENWDLGVGASLNFYRFGLPDLDNIIVEDKQVPDRGFYRDFESYPLILSLSYNSLDEPYAATKGHKFSVSYSYAPVSRYNGTRDHNYHVVESRITRYSLLGSRSYAMTVAESNANREKLKNLTFAEAIEILNPINIKEETLDRRVLITQLKTRYMIEENKGKAPFTAMSQLGSSFPLRAYVDGYFTAPLVAGISAEYRWPVDQFADALIFNEYGIYGEDFNRLSAANIKNSYGFGFRIRTPKFFIARFALAFHGLQGITLLLTTRPDYE